MSSSKIQEYNLDPNMGLAKESTAQEILEKLSDGVAGVTAQTKKFTEFEFGTVGQNANKLITGSGRCLIASTNGKVSVDGKTAISLYDSNWKEVYFEESIQLFGGTSSSNDKVRYFVQT